MWWKARLEALNSSSVCYVIFLVLQKIRPIQKTEEAVWISKLFRGGFPLGIRGPVKPTLIALPVLVTP